jgi:putative membrane protein
VLVAAVAAHDVLAKLIYAAPPDGVAAAQAEAAGVLMHYGGTPVHVVLFVLLGREWAAAQRRAARRAPLRLGPAAAGSP